MAEVHGAAPVLIIGTGLGGLTLAQGLRKASRPFKIFERLPRKTSRGQGYRIRLHGEGLRALRSNLTPELWESFRETCAETRLGPLPSINPVTGEIVVEDLSAERNPQARMKESSELPYTVDRAVLREVLLDGLDDNVVYEKVYQKYTLENGRIKAHFADGSVVDGVLLVGADGVHSAVRKQHVPNLRILDTNIRPVYGKTPLSASLEDRVLPKALDVLSLIKDPVAKSLTLLEAIKFAPKDKRKDQRDLPADYVYWAIIPGPSASGAVPEESHGKPSKTFVHDSEQLTAHWEPTLKLLIDEQDTNMTGAFNLLSTDPESLKVAWPADCRVTIMGDAAHAMLPFAASGAVTALKDAEALAKVICEEGISNESIGRYESAMRQYASEAVAFSAGLGEKVFGIGSIAHAQPMKQ